MKKGINIFGKNYCFFHFSWYTKIEIRRGDKSISKKYKNQNFSIINKIFIIIGRIQSKN